MNSSDKKVLYEKADKAKVISFDLFDTLLFRKTATPEEVFDIVGDHFGIPGFRKIRIDAQNEASRKVTEKYGYPHPDMDEIYEELGSCGEIASVDKPDLKAQEIKNYEISVEEDALYANDEMLEVFNDLKNRGKRIVITTDMYLKAVTIEGFLKKNGFKGYDKLYCSADERKAKFNKELFEEVAKREGVSFNEILHIGDNESADVSIPGSLGIDTFLYKRGSEEHFWQDFGERIAGPVQLGLYRWLEKEVREARDNGENFYFLSRDGYYLHYLFKKSGYDNIKYLYASRRSLIMAGVTELDEDSLNVFPPYSFGQTLGEVIDYLGLKREDIKHLDEAGFTGFDDVIAQPGDLDRVKKLYTLNPEAVLERCRIERENALRYFREEGLINNADEIASKEGQTGRKIRIFDCGWNGSSQYLLDRALKAINLEDGTPGDTAPETFFYYFGILNTKKSLKQLRGKRYKTYLFDFYRDYNLQRQVLHAIELYELMFSAPHPSVYIYSEDGVIFEKGEKEAYREEILKGIEKYFDRVSAFSEKYIKEIPKESVVTQLERLINHPTVDEARIIGDTPNSDGIVGKTGARKRLAFCTEEELELNPRLDGYWLEGLLTRGDVSDKVKSAAIKRKGPVPSDAPGGYRLEQTVDYLYYRNRYKYYFGEREEKELGHRPFFSMVMPVYNVKSEQLREAVDSVLAQTYTDYELILVDDHSTWDNVVPILKEYEKDPHVKVIYREVNGNISRATNDGIAAAKGEYLFFMDCDDTIEPYAFYEFASKINENPELDFIYSDEDKLTEDGKVKHLPFFKPDWSPDLFWCENYTNHLSAYRMDVVRKTGGLRSKYDGAQDYDFVLRFMEKSDNSRVGHISRVLYHWREREESVAYSLGSKSYATMATGFLKEEALSRRGIKGEARLVSEVSQYRIVYEPVGDPKVSIIIPSKDNPNLLRQCIESVVKHTDYKNYEIIVVDNGSSKDNKTEIESYLREVNRQRTASEKISEADLSHKCEFCRYIYEKKDFNFSHMCNLGAKSAKGEYLLFLNDDIEAIEGSWLEKMLGQSMQDHAGAVGAKLFYPGRTAIQHAGVSNLKEGPGHVFFGQDDAALYYFGLNRLESNFSAVTAACLMISKEKFINAGMFDEALKVAYNDIDLCFSLCEAGLYNTVRQDVILYHHESFSRGSDDEAPKKKKRLEAERKRLYNKHPEMKGRDPFLSPNIHYYFGPELDLNPVCGEISVLDDYGSVPMGRAFIDRIYKQDKIFVIGWALVEESENSPLDEKYLILDNGKGEKLRIRADIIKRDDVADALGGRDDLRYCGLKCVIDPESLTGKDGDREAEKANLFTRFFKHEESYKLGIQLIDGQGVSHIWWDEERGFAPFPQ